LTAACRECHSDIYRTYLETGMGRSFARVRSVPSLEGFFHAASDRYYRVIEREGKWFLQRRGGEANVMEKQIHYFIGSGNHARTYVHRAENGTLLELPVSWYAEKGGYWAMSPGYDRPNHDDFRRPVTDECLFCHNAYPGPGGELAQGIDCQRCHGPGQAHERAAKSLVRPQKIRAAIVNPRRLSAAQQLELCLQCHLETTSRRLPNAIRRYDRRPFSYRPGEPLASYMLHFDHPKGSGHDDKFEVNHAGYRFLQSRCYRASAGRMQCTTCHDPHRARRGEDAAAHYRQVCRSCHVPAGSHPAGEDCLGCHMPKRRAEDAVHVVMTDHRIERRPAPPEPAPAEKVYRGRVELFPLPQPPDAKAARLYLAVAQLKDAANLKQGIPELERAIAELPPAEAEFYLELAEAYSRIGAPEPAIKYYREAINRNPRLPRAYARLGDILLRRGEGRQAAAILEKGLERAGGSAEIATVLGVAYGQLGRLEASVEALRKAVRSNPDLPLAWLNLGVTQEQKGERAAAEASYREAIRIQPDFNAARERLGNLRSNAIGTPAPR
jgi:predicted CXXCH cytochrome family protein